MPYWLTWSELSERKGERNFLIIRTKGRSHTTKPFRIEVMNIVMAQILTTKEGNKAIYARIAKMATKSKR